MSDQIHVLIVDDIGETREHLAKLIAFEPDIEVVGAVASGAEALAIAPSLLPDIVLMDINMPDMDGIAATELMSSQVPSAAIVMMSVQGETDYLRRAMLAGAREFLVKPFGSGELAACLRHVHARQREEQRTGRAPAAHSASNAAAVADREPGRVIAVFGPKGGVGRTTIAVNAAVAATTELRQGVCLLDGSLQFGDVGIMLNLSPKSSTIADLGPGLEVGGTLESLDDLLISHSSGMRVLLAPPSPTKADLITPACMTRVVEVLRRSHDLVIVDCASALDDSTIAILDSADLILVVISLEITSIRNVRLFLEMADRLGYAPDRIQFVLNRADVALGIRVADVERSMGRAVDHSIVSDGRTVGYALNRGVPVVISNPVAQVSQDILRLARSLSASAEPALVAGRKEAPGASRVPGARGPLHRRIRAPETGLA